MKYATAAAAIAAVAEVVYAKDSISPAFKLTVSSDDKALDGKTISSCYNGAAIEALCIDKELDAGVYNIRDTIPAQTKRQSAVTTQGLLTYTITVNTNSSVVEPLQLEKATDKGLQLAQFTPDTDGITVGVETTGSEEHLAAQVDGNWGEGWVICPAQLYVSTEKVPTVYYASDASKLPKECSQVRLAKTDV